VSSMNNTSHLDYEWTYYYDYNLTDLPTPEIQPIQIIALVFYALVVLLGVPGNAVVVWVTGFCMPSSVTSLWFLNLALADLLCCLSLPLLMVPLAHDDHWPFGPMACMLVRSLFYLVMYCSILQLVVISIDRWLMVSKPIWCQNNRRPKLAALGCVVVWLLALLGTIPHFLFTREIEAGEDKRECVAVYARVSAWSITSFRSLVGFFLPFLVIVVCHWVVYQKANSGSAQRHDRSKKTLRIIVTMAACFFLCFLPLHVVDFLGLVTPRSSPYGPHIYIAHVLTLCLAYFNSCLNPLLYACLGRGFKDSMNRSLRGLFTFISEDPAARASISHDTRSTSGANTLSMASVS
uniref:Complement C5a receptor 1 n=2 Tax=Tetraodon nigroviridis TaxID=99883 RepID=H3D2F1_TETNG